MTDPIRPFINLVESIASTTATQKSREAAAQGAIAKPSRQNSSNSNAALSFTERLKTRLSVIDRKDRRMRRQVFIEVALLTELGEQLAMDHALSDLIEKVSSLIAANDTMVTDLDAALDKVDATTPL